MFIHGTGNYSTLWHAGSDSRRYEASGSRTPFANKWDAHRRHMVDEHQEIPETLRLMMDILQNEERARWLSSVKLLDQ